MLEVLCACGRVRKLSQFVQYFNTSVYRIRSSSIGRKSLKRHVNFSQRWMSSVLYPGRYREGSSDIVEVDLGLTQRFKNIRTLYENIRQRNLTDDVNVYHLASMHKTLRDVEKTKLQLDEAKVEIALKMNHLVKMEQTESVKEKKKELIAQGKEVRETLKEINKHYYQLEEEVMLYALQLPSDLHHTTPKEDTILDELGSINAEMSRKSVGHMLIGKKTGTIFKKNVGPVKYYLRNEAADLEEEIGYRLGQKMRQQGFTQIACPDMVKTVVVEGTAQNIINPKQAYVLEDKNVELKPCDAAQPNTTLHLAGASPQAFTAAVVRTNTQEHSLPLKWFTLQTSYNPDRSTEYSDLFASPQSQVVEIFGAAKDELDVTSLYNDLYSTVWSLYSMFEDHLNLRAVSRCAPHLARYESSRVDIQAWSYGLQQYVTVGSIAMWSDFIGRRLMAKWSPNVEQVLPSHFLHTVHGTAYNITSLVALLMEAHQTSSGHFKLPEDVFQEWRMDAT